MIMNCFFFSLKTPIVLEHLLLFIFFYFIFYFWLCWVFVSVRGLSLVVASGGLSSSRCAGLSLSRPLLLRSAGSRRAGSVVVAHGRSCSAACGIFPDQGSNTCPLHQQADSQPLRHQGSPQAAFIRLFNGMGKIFTQYDKKSHNVHYDLYFVNIYTSIQSYVKARNIYMCI